MSDIVINPPRRQNPVVVEAQGVADVSVRAGRGPAGPPGIGVPSGGSAGQVLAKASGADYATGWVDVSGGVTAWTDITGKPTFATVATTGVYGDLTGIPATFAPSAHGHAQADVTGLVASLADKQETLVSGTNIKTINGTSVLGSGDIVVSGGGGLAGASFVTVPMGSYSHAQTIAATGVTPANIIIAGIGVFQEADENDTEFLDIAGISAIAGTDQITVNMAFSTPTAGLIRINWSAF